MDWIYARGRAAERTCVSKGHFVHSFGVFGARRSSPQRGDVLDGYKFRLDNLSNLI
jgi:hypothetical protein